MTDAEESAVRTAASTSPAANGEPAAQVKAISPNVKRANGDFTGIKEAPSKPTEASSNDSPPHATSVEVGNASVASASMAPMSESDNASGLAGTKRPRSTSRQPDGAAQMPAHSSDSTHVISSDLDDSAKGASKSDAHAEGSKKSVSERSHDDEKEDEEGDGQQRRFQCHLCDRAFARAYNLNTHLATHDPDPNRAKPFPCPYASCKADGGRSFSRKHDLQRHVASTHENEPEPADAGETDEKGNRTGGLASLGLGTPGRKFRCDECGRAFVRRDALKRHQCMPTGSPTSSTGGAPTTAGARTAGRVASPSTPRSTFDTAPDSPFYGTAASAVSLYTSTGTHPTGSSSSSSSVAQRYSNGLPSTYDANAPFYPSGLTYESLTREDVAEQLVAQASSYNDKLGEGDRGDPQWGRYGSATHR